MKAKITRMEADSAPAFQRGGQAAEMPKRHGGKKSRKRKKARAC